MQQHRPPATVALALCLAGAATGAVGPNETQQLGAALTAAGAEQAGNADDSRPPCGPSALQLDMAACA